MKLRREPGDLMAVVVAILFLVIVVFWLDHWKAARQDCDAAGGVLVRGDLGFVCVARPTKQREATRP